MTRRTVRKPRKGVGDNIRKPQRGLCGDNQRQATERWLDKPGVREAQREKARLRSARNRALKKALGLHISSDRTASRDRATSASPKHSLSDFNNASLHKHTPYEESPATSLTTRLQSTDLPSLPTLTALQVKVNEWQVKWGPETAWGKYFDSALQHSRKKGWESTDHFFHECEQHALKGRAILRSVREHVQMPHTSDREMIGDQLLQVYDMLMMVLSEVRFFEVKLDSLCPCGAED
ncbi:hypothetical protein BJ138DRAFT_1119564 [Hygrophoropsis aurantiaca]|uniref:Uncharacterized protein n=1 Tax=Hygrophoropsis aurantiaca TaxID=72124 RepID=A0ACB7ZVB4_9AGAM|nr:hypothetical protein BJ138DRAFT_1119564 [Hygrophoropsis aurantiaca]